MKYLADEDVARPIVRWLRGRGNDVRYAAEEKAGEFDGGWLREAESEGRLLLTADKDFGELLFRDGLNSHGVVLIRLEKLGMNTRVKRLEKAWPVVEANPSGCFIVITPHRVRIRPLSQCARRCDLSTSQRDSRRRPTATHELLGGAVPGALL